MGVPFPLCETWRAYTRRAAKRRGWDGSWCGTNESSLDPSARSQIYARRAKLALLFLERCVGSPLSWSTDDVSAISRMVPDFGASWRRYFGDASPDTAQAAQQVCSVVCCSTLASEAPAAPSQAIHPVGFTPT